MKETIQPIVFNKKFIYACIQLLKPYWCTKEKWRAVALLLLAVALTIVGVRASVSINNANKQFFDALQQFDIAAVYASFWPFGLGIFTWITAECIAFYCKERLNLNWRRWLTTDTLTRWFGSARHYQLQLEGQIDNPDQRISEDLAQCPGLTLALCFLLLSVVMTLGSYSAILWNISKPLMISIGHTVIPLHGYLFWCAIGYGLTSLCATQYIGKRLSVLDFLNERYGAHYRFALIRSREHSEQIALMKSDAAETSHLMKLFQRVLENTLRIIQLKTRLNGVLSFFSGSGAIVGSIAALPLFFSKQIQMGTLMQASGAFAMVFSSFTILAQSFELFAQWKSVIFRLTQFHQALTSETSSSELRTVVHPHGVFKVEALSIQLPQGTLILDQWSMAFEAGQSYLLQGPPGIGKSLLLQTLAGIWPYASGQRYLPQDKKIGIIPQKPYLPIGSLKAWLLASSVEDSEALLISYLEQVSLQKYLTLLDEEHHWQQRLSLGEQQLFFLIKILMQRPDIVLLDESTAALDEPTEALFYQVLYRTLSHATVISVGHRTTLYTYHQHVITLCAQDQPNVVKQDLMLA